MMKKLVPIGNGFGIVIERSLLELLDITKDTSLEIQVDGDGLVLRPMKQAPSLDRVLAAADELMNAHDETFRRLAK